MGGISIQSLGAANVDALRQLSVDTFTDTYARYNTQEDMFLYINKHFSAEQLLTEIKEACNFFFGAFSNDGQMVGYVKLRTSEKPAELATLKHIELERIYVSKAYHGKGLGSVIMQHCLAFALQQHYEVLWLGVWTKNEKAMAFYKKWGFEIFGKHTFMLGKDAQVDWLMKKHLNIPQ
ncbi:GNAT family N-acetyltransferase [Panacibacter sp. DH6]|uniref:GNAT family N-acetyltransferase n=2 Tax=Panacibacter microcysteis TaxID=2793269 RepID=A0A931E3S4_9BACT|nr:GNAT family N-acetyltransferase [Panacibacter microcysteis]MBG9377085.1 GNAT family N-acetyltransferase [Panacibacter microcysteis]